MATIVNSMNRVISNSKKENQIIQILIKSLLIGMGGYSIVILAMIGTFGLISNSFKQVDSQVSSTAFIIASVVYLMLYSGILIKEMKKNNFLK